MPATDFTPRQRSIVEFLRELPGSAQRFWFLVIATGAVSGVGAVVLVRCLALTQHLLWPPGATFQSAVGAAGALRRLAVPLVPALIVALLIRRTPLENHGTSGILEAIWLRGGKLPFVRTLLSAVISIFAVGAGAPLGREGALIQVGAATASSVGRVASLPVDQVRLLVACGAASGIAAAYNVPIGGALFGLEVLLGSFALEMFGPIVISCVVATLLSRVLVGDHPSYTIPRYTLGAPRDLLLDLLLGPAFGVASAIYVMAVDALAAAAARVGRRWKPLLPIAALGLVGGAAIVFPQILGNGYDVVDAALLGTMPLAALVALPAIKTVATSASSAAGVPGGMFTPSLFIGALLGGAAGHLAHVLVPGTAPSGAYALVGMGAILAGTTHAAVSAVIIIFEMTGDYGVILPLMLACVLSAATSRRLMPRSLYTASLKRRNVALPELNRTNWLRAVRVAAILMPDVDVIAPAAPFTEVSMRLLALPPGRDLYVTDGGRYLGAIVLDRLKGNFADRHDLQAVVAADVMARVPPLLANQSFSEAVARFSSTDLDKLPVVHPATGELVGCVSKSELLSQGRY